MVWSTVSYCASEKASVSVTCIGVSHSTSVTRPFEFRPWHWWRCRVWLWLHLLIVNLLNLLIFGQCVTENCCVERSTSYLRRVVRCSSSNASFSASDLIRVGEILNWVLWNWEKTQLQRLRCDSADVLFPYVVETLLLCSLGVWFYKLCSV
jgi:hypothetical protein